MLKFFILLTLFSYTIQAQNIQKSSFDYFQIDIINNDFKFSKKIEDAGYEFINTKNPDFRFLVNRYKYLPNWLENIADIWIKDLLLKSSGSEKNRKKTKIKIGNLDGIEIKTQIILGANSFYINVITIQDEKYIYSIATLLGNQNFEPFKKVAQTFSIKK